MLARSPLVRRLVVLAGLLLAAGVGLGFWAYRTIYLPRRGHTENAVLAADNLTAFQTIDKIILRIRLLNSGSPELRGTLHIELTDPRGKVLGERDKAISQTEAAADYRVEIPIEPVAAAKVTLQCSLGKQRLAVPLVRVLAVRVHETSLTADREFIAGTPAALRCGVHAVQSLSGDIPVINTEIRAGGRTRRRTLMQRTPEAAPLIGAAVRVNLRSKDGTIYTLHEGLTGKDGWDQAAFTVPAVLPGVYTLQVTTASDLGEENLEQSVRVTAPTAVRLATDKTLYQPGQVIHVRGRACRPFDHKPVAGAALALTVEDGRGRLILERSQPTAADGAAAVDCPLADDAPAGDYHVRAVLGDLRAETTVGVRRPTRPRFRVRITTDKSYYAPGETVRAEIRLENAAGKPAPGATLAGAAASGDETSRPFTTWEGAVDTRGRAHWDIRLPNDFAGPALHSSRAEVRLEVKATDLAEHTEMVRRSLPVSDRQIRVSLIPEGGRLVPDLENRVYVTALYPDGRPAVGSVIVRQGKESHGQVLTSVRTSPAGLAEFRFTPRRGDFRAGPRRQHVKEILGNRQETEFTPELLFDLVTEARDAAGHTAQGPVTLTGNPLGENLVLRLDRSLYRPGEPLGLEVLATPGLTRLSVDVVRDGQLVLTRNLAVQSGVAEARLELPPDVAGALEVHAYQAVNTGEILRDARVVYVTPAGPGAVAAAGGGPPRFRSGAAAGETGAAIVVDGTAYPLADLSPGREKVYAMLQGQWPKPPAAGDGPPGRDWETAERRQQLAGALLAAVRPRPPQTWVVEPVVQRHYRQYDQARRVAWGIFAYAHAGRPFMDYDARTGRWLFRPNLLQEMVAAKALDAALLDGPFGGRLTLDDLPRWEPNFTVDRVAELVTWERWQRLIDLVGRYTAGRPEFHPGDRWNLPATVLADAVRDAKQDPLVLKDAWGGPTRLVRRPYKLDNRTGRPLFDSHELVSAGPDRTFDTSDDLRLFDPILRQHVQEPLFGISLADYLEGGPAAPDSGRAG